jgi:allophanate hydrolase subunit 2
MVKGAIERTPAGLVVLGPDHPTTGGYPVIGVLPEDALDGLMALPIGAPVRLLVAREKTT